MNFIILAIVKFLRNIWRKNVPDSLIFGSTPYELREFLCGIGESEIKENFILLKNYPFEPASVFPETAIYFNEIDEIHVDDYPPTLKIGQELIFISRELVQSLTDFAHRNNISVAKRASNWMWISEPFLDTEFSSEQQERTFDLLNEHGFTKKEVIQLRKEIEEQMYKYNFDTMLWEWGILGLNDVLAAMRPKLDKEKFKNFYWRAMEIEQRNNAETQ